jgi:hypothetical protein
MERPVDLKLYFQTVSCVAGVEVNETGCIGL